MITCGLDLGTGSTKAVLLEDGRRILASNTVTAKGQPATLGAQALAGLVAESGVKPNAMACVCTTGFGRYAYPDRTLQVSDITASARGAWFLNPATRHVLDIGSQSSRAIAVSERGRVLNFKMNEKCAAGAGRFVERCSKYLQVPLADMGPRAATSTKPHVISSVCAVLAETEIINFVAEEVPIQDILMGVFLSLAQRGHALMKNVGILPQVTLVGGLVHNEGMVKALRDTLRMELPIDPRAHHAAALGAAILAHARLTKLNQTEGKTAPAPAAT